MKNLKEILESVALKKQHEENELHQFCREIDDLVKQGMDCKTAYYYMKYEYQRRYDCKRQRELEKLK